MPYYNIGVSILIVFFILAIKIVKIPLRSISYLKSIYLNIFCNFSKSPHNIEFEYTSMSDFNQGTWRLSHRVFMPKVRVKNTHLKMYEERCLIIFWSNYKYIKYKFIFVPCSCIIQIKIFCEHNFTSQLFQTVKIFCF